MLANLLSPIDWPEIKASNALLVDATWGPPGAEGDIPEGVLPDAIFFDLAKIKSIPVVERTPKVISQLLSKAGIVPSDDIVIYDRRGVFSAPRLWWLLMRVGHTNVSILNGGLGGIQKQGTEISSAHHIKPQTKYIPRKSLASEANLQDVLNGQDQIIDARSAGRFYGTEPEPRAGLRSGHIPGALSLPYSGLVNDGFIRPDVELSQAVGAAGIDLSKPIITTCGSGVTAAGLAFIFTRLGAKDVRVYTGSWSEYGATDAPIER